MEWILLFILVVLFATHKIKKYYGIQWQSFFVVYGFILSFIACLVTYLRIEIYTTNDTFVGVLASFIGVCVTLIVGLQIYNSIDTRNKIKSLNDEYKSKFASLEEIQKQISSELEQSREERKRCEIEMKRSICRVKSISLSEIQPFTAFISMVQSLHHSLELADADLIALSIKDLQALNGIIEKRIYSNVTIDITHCEKVKEIKTEDFQKYKLFPLIISSVNEILQGINKSINTYKSSLP